MAAATDKARKSYSFLQKTLSTGIDDNDTVLTPNSMTNIPTGTGVTMIIDRVDSTGTATPTNREIVTGVVSGGTIIDLIRGEHGTTAQAHSAGAVIEFVMAGNMWNDLIDLILTHSDQDGTLKAGAVDNAAVLASDVVTTAKILDSNVTTAKIADSNVTQAKLAAITRKREMLPTGGTSDAFNSLPDATTSTVPFFGTIPDDYVSGDITIKRYIRAGATGTAVLRYYLYRSRDGQALATVDNGVNINQTFASTITSVSSRTLAAADFQAGDSIRISIERLGSDGSDTLAGALGVDAVVMEYTGRA